MSLDSGSNRPRMMEAIGILCVKGVHWVHFDVIIDIVKVDSSPIGKVWLFFSALVPVPLIILGLVHIGCSDLLFY